MDIQRLNEWLSEELKLRGWSYRELARQADLTQSLVSRTLSGKRDVDLRFCTKIADALGEPPEKVLRLLGILSSVSEDDPTIVEIQDILRNLSPQHREEALRYLRYLYHNE